MEIVSKNILIKTKMKKNNYIQNILKKDLPKKNTKKKENLIDILHDSLNKAGYVVERDGWKETENNIPPNDNCEWLDIIIKDKSNNKYTVHLYFTNNSTTLNSVELYKSELKYDDAKIIAR